MLGAEALVVSQVGDDDLGHKAIAAPARARRKHRLRRDEPGTSDWNRSGRARLGRPARYTIARDVAWDFIPWSKSLQSLATRADAVCFGTFAQRSETSRE